MQTITTIGLDIAKSVFQVHGVDAGGQVIVRRQLKRRYVLTFFQKLSPCLVEPLRHPKAPGLSLTGFRLVLADHALGLPVLRALSLCTCCRHYPGAASGRTASLTSPSRISLPRKGRRVGLRIVLFEACSAFTRVTACTLAPSPIRDARSEGFSYFVTSIAAPVASGWSVCRVGLAPTGKRRLVTAHTQRGHPNALSIHARCRGGSGSSRDQDRGPQITLPCRMSLTSSGEQPSHS